MKRLKLFFLTVFFYAISLAFSVVIIGPFLSFYYSGIDGMHYIARLLGYCAMYGLPLTFPVALIFSFKHCYNFFYWGLAGVINGWLICYLMVYAHRAATTPEEAKVYHMVVVTIMMVSVLSSLLCCLFIKRTRMGQNFKQTPLSTV